jgi:hypothetical protein
MTVLIYLRKLCSKWMEMVTSGLIAIFLALQPYTGISAPHKWVFWTILAGASVIASYRVWKDEYQLAEDRAQLILQAASSEPARIHIAVAWHCAANASSSGVRLLARNLGRVPLREFAMHPLQLGLWSVEFQLIPTLQTDTDQELITTLSGPMATPGTNDLLDVLMVNYTGIAPRDYALDASVIKANGQQRILQFSLAYAPLHNPRRVGIATEPERCLTIQQVSAG